MTSVIFHFLLHFVWTAPEGSDPGGADQRAGKSVKKSGK
jgi:hypothetical protein